MFCIFVGDLPMAWSILKSFAGVAMLVSNVEEITPLTDIGMLAEALVQLYWQKKIFCQYSLFLWGAIKL